MSIIDELVKDLKNKGVAVGEHEVQINLYVHNRKKSMVRSKKKKKKEWF